MKKTMPNSIIFKLFKISNNEKILKVVTDEKDTSEVLQEREHHTGWKTGFTERNKEPQKW